MQNCSKEIIRKYARVPAQQDHSPPPPRLSSPIPGFPRLAAGKAAPSIRIIMPGSSQWLWEDVWEPGLWRRCPKGRVRTALPRARHHPGSPGGRERGQGCQQSLGGYPHPQPALSLGLPQLPPQPRKLSPLPANPFYSALSSASMICPSCAKILHSQQRRLNPSAAGPTAAPRPHSRGTKAPLCSLRTSASRKGCPALALAGWARGREAGRAGSSVPGAMHSCSGRGQTHRAGPVQG